MRKKFEIYFEYKGEYILLSNFNSSVDIAKTFDERLTEEENGKSLLNFSIAKTSQKQSSNNMFTPEGFDLGRYLKIGRKIKLILENKTLYFIVSSIAPQGSSDNIIWNIEATDLFSFIFSRNNLELSLNTFSDDDFLSWMEETKVSELELEKNSELNALNLFRVGTVKDIAEYVLYRGNLRSEDLENSWKIEILDILNDPANQKVNIELSNSNTYNALVELTFLNNSLLHINYDTKTLRFIDKDSDFFRKNYVLSPEFNLQDLNLNYNSESFSPIFFVTGGEDEYGLSVGITPNISYAQYQRIKNAVDYIRYPNVSTVVAYPWDGTAFPVSFQTTEDLEENEFIMTFNGSEYFPAQIQDMDYQLINFRNTLLSSSIKITYGLGSQTFKNVSNYKLRYIEYNGENDYRVQLLNEKNEIVFDKALEEGIYKEVEGENIYYFGVSFIFDSNIDVENYKVEIEEKGYYSDIFPTKELFQGNEKMLDTLNFIPYLDTFILSLEYFLNNDFLNQEEIIDIKNSIYNDLRYINLDFQIAIFNKYAIEGEIQETENKILNFADQLAVWTDANYTEIDNELKNIFFQEAGALKEGLVKPLFAEKNLDEYWEIPTAATNLTKTYRELMANGFFFYEINQEEYLTLLNKGFAIWESDIINKKDLLYTYDNGTEIQYFVSSNIKTDYPFKLESTYDGDDFSSLVGLELSLNRFGDSYELDEVVEGKKVFDFSRFWQVDATQRFYKYFISGDLRKNNISNISYPPLVLNVSEYKKRWKNYVDYFGSKSYSTYIVDSTYSGPDTFYGPDDVVLVAIEAGSPWARKYKKIKIESNTLNLVPRAKDFYVGGTYWGGLYYYSKILSDPYEIPKNLESMDQLRIFDFKINGTSYVVNQNRYGQKTGIKLTRSGFPDVFVEFEKGIGGYYFNIKDPTFQLENYKDYKIVIQYALTDFAYNEPSLEYYVGQLYVSDQAKIMGVLSNYEYQQESFKFDNGVDPTEIRERIPVNGKIRWSSGVVTESRPSPNTYYYSYKIESLNATNRPTLVEFQKFEWYLDEKKENFSGALELKIESSKILIETIETDTSFNRYGYFDLLSLYKGTDFNQKRLNLLKEEIITYIDEKRVIENDLETAKIDLEIAKSSSEIDKIKALEAQVAALEKDLDAYLVVVGNWEYNRTEDTITLIPGDRTGQKVIFYEFFEKYLGDYLNETTEIEETQSIYYTYRSLEKAKNKFWYDLKQKYGDYLYEGYYENETESDSWNLLLQALKIIKYHNTPSEEYSLTYIDGSQVISKNIDLIEVGDYIKIRGEKLGMIENESNEIQVTSITRELRDASNIQLTVNQTRRADSIIEKLISGINK